MIDMNYFSQYSSEIGFRAGVEALHNNTLSNAFFAVIISVCPTASFYDVNREGPPTDVTYSDHNFLVCCMHWS